MLPASDCDRTLVRDDFIKTLRALDCSGNHESFMSIYIIYIIHLCLWLKDVFLLLCASSSEALGFLFYFSLLFFFAGDNIAYGSRRQGWMVCVGTLIICMSPQNALLLFAPPGCCACFTSSLPQSQEVQGNKASAIQSRRSRVPTRIRSVVCIR